MSDPTHPDLPADEVDEVEEVQEGQEAGFEDKQRLLDRFRGTGVGVEDPNIVGDVGPTDVPPGQDPDSADLPPGLAGEDSDEDLAPGRDPDTGLPGA